MEDSNKKYAGVRPQTLDEPRALVTDGFQDLPPSYEASTGVSSHSSGNAPSELRSRRDSGSSISSTHSHHGLLDGGVSQPPAPEPQPYASEPPPAASQVHACGVGEGSPQGYRKNDPMYWDQRSWDHLRGTPGCCGSSSGGCCFSSRGGCCFSDRGGCCFSDREGCCFSDRAGCCCGDLTGACCSDGR